MIVVNRLGQEFEYELQGNEYYVPQIPNELSYFDWEDGLMGIWQDANKESKYNGILVVPRTNNNEFYEIRIGDKIPKSGKIFSGVTLDKIKKLEKLDLFALYAVGQSGEKLRIPPLRKDLFLDKKEKDETKKTL